MKSNMKEREVKAMIKTTVVNMKQNMNHEITSVSLCI